MADFSGLKAGDKVIVSRGGFNHQERRIEVVQRVLKTHVVVDGDKLRRQGGYQAAKGWYRLHLEPWTPEAEAEITQASRRCEHLHRIGFVRWDDLSDEVLARVAELVGGP